MFLLASIGRRSQIFNSGGKIHMFNSNDKYKALAMRHPSGDLLGWQKHRPKNKVQYDLVEHGR